MDNLNTLNVKYAPNHRHHVVIRREEYVAGTQDKPEVSVFVQTNRSKRPLNPRKVKPGDTIWMKWAGGPIVAKATITQTHSGTVRNGQIQSLKEITKNTRLYDVDQYWDTLLEKRNFHYMVIELTDEAWLEEPIFPEARSIGASWIFLNSQSQIDAWINSKRTENKTKKPSRNIPAGLRFKILRRDNFTCQYCGRFPPTVQLHIDHKIPWSKVHEHKEDNLVVACAECNLGKSNNYY